MKCGSIAISTTGASGRCRQIPPLCHPERSETAAGRLSCDGKSQPLFSDCRDGTTETLLPRKRDQGDNPGDGGSVKMRGESWRIFFTSNTPAPQVVIHRHQAARKESSC